MLGRLFWILCSLRMMVSPFLDGTSSYDYDQRIDPTIPVSKDDYPINRRTSLRGESPRLPDHVTPYHYDVTLKLHVKATVPHFDGATKILLTSAKSTTTLRLNAKGLHLRDFSLFEADGKHPTFIETIEEITDFEQIVLYLYSPLLVNVNYTLHVAYRGNMVYHFNGLGMYWDVYLDNGQFRYLAATQFSPSGARNVLPCFDEPRYKATFKLSVWHTTGTTALSNMPTESTDRYDRWSLDRFQQTPKMSTYLLALVVMQYDHKEYLRNDGTLLRVWARAEQLPYVTHCLEITDKLMTYFENYTGIRYELPKLDILTTPSHPVRAMENWGLMIFQEHALIWQDSVMMSTQYSQVTLTLAHEICHMWFGNLVTQRWWDEVWLKEGLASYFMYEAVRSIYPEWGLDNLFLWHTMYTAMSVDKTLDVTPVVNNVQLPGQIREVFTEQVYYKGAFIIRSIQALFGKTIFEAAIKRFINKHKYGNVITSDLWQAFSDVIPDYDFDSDISSDVIFRFLDIWLKKPGYPYLTVTWNGDNEAKLSQERFVDKIREKRPTADRPSYVWPIPLNVTILQADTGEAVLHIFHWMTNRKELAVITSDSPDVASVKSVFLTNIEQTGFYRIVYENSWQDIIGLLMRHHRAIPVTTRAQLIDDSFKLSRNGYAKETLPFTVMQYMEYELDDLPWHVTLNNIGYVISLISYTDMANYVKRMGRRIMKYKYEDLGWKVQQNETVLRRMVRQELLAKICEFGYEACLNHTRTEFIKWKEEPNYTLQSDVRSIVLCYGIKQGSVDDWLYVYNISLTDQSYYAAHAEILSCTENVTLLNRFLNQIVAKGKYNNWDLNNLVNTRLGKAAAWKYLKHIWRNTSQRINHGSFLLKFSSSLTSESDLKQMDVLIRSNPDQLFDDIYNMSRELIIENIRWMQENEPSLQRCFKRHQINTANSTQFYLRKSVVLITIMLLLYI